MKSYKILSLVFFFLSLVGALYLVKVNQDNRNRATTSCTGTWTCSKNGTSSTYNCSIFNGMNETGCTGGSEGQGNYCAPTWTRSGGCSFNSNPLQCPSGQKFTDETWGWHDIQCGQGCPAGQGKKARCNWSPGACVVEGSNSYLNACKDASGVEHWEFSSCETNSVCEQQEAQIDKNHESDIITFSSSGKVHLYFKYLDNLNSASPGWKIRLIPQNGGASVADLSGTTSEKDFSNIVSVTAGKTYQVQVIFDEDLKTRPAPATSYGWVKPQGEQCIGKNGSATATISDAINHVKSISNLKTSDPLANPIQCWADAVGSGNPLEDYDFNDFVLIFSYEKTTPPTSTPTPTNTPKPTSTTKPSPTPTGVSPKTTAVPPTSTPTPTNTPKPTSTPTPTPTNTPTPTPTNTPTPTPTPTNTPLATSTPTNTPVATSAPTNTPIATLAPTNTLVPTQVLALGPSPTRIVLPQSGFEFPSQALAIIGGIATLLGFLILL